VAGKRISPRVPFDPARFPFYYGWLVGVVGTLGMMATVPATPPGFAPFVDPVMDELGITRARLTFAFTWGTIGAGLVIPFAGFWVDRLGVRFSGMISFACLGASMLAIGNPGVFTGLLEAIGFAPEAAVFVFLFLVFFLLRFWGLGMTMTVCRSMVFRWFVRWRSLVAGVNGMVLSLCFSSAPALLNGLVVGIGWKETWQVLGLVVAGGFGLLCFVFFRDSPEACGIPVQRGKETGDTGEDGPGSLVRRDYTAREAMRTAAFWLMVAGLAMNAFIGTGTAFHIVSVGEDLGDLPRAESLRILLYVGIFNVATSLSLGFLAERIRLRYLLCFLMACQTISLAGLLHFRTEIGFWAFAAGSGCAWGTFGILINVPWPRFFGRKHLGSINGIVTGAVVVFSAIGPYAFGLSHAWTDSYRATVTGCLCLTPVLALLGLAARNPRRR
jgi:MFS family permease